MPTIKTLEKNIMELPIIYLDEGATGPIQRGANVMAPGIYKYINMCTGDFKTNDVVCISIIEKGILAVGMALLDKNNLTEHTAGEAVTILHIDNDELFNKY